MEVRDFGLALLVLAAVGTDWRRQRLPNILTVPGAVAGAALNMAILGPAEGLRFALEGLTVGLLLPLVPFALGGMGGGDVKLFAALGAWTGPGGILSIFLFAALTGGLAGLFILIYKRRLANLRRVWEDMLHFFLARTRPEKRADALTMPYSLAIAAGVMGAKLFGYLW